jgi:hypothetical protein
MPSPIYSTVTVETVEFTQNNNFAAQGDLIGSLPGPAVESLGPDFDFFDGSVFAVGVHAVEPDIGSGSAGNLDSLIGLKILEPGTYTDVTVPIFPVTSFPDLTDIEPGQIFPPNPDGETEVQAAIWKALGPGGLDDPPDNADDAPEDPSDLIEPFAVSQQATISNLDQNLALDPTDVSNPAVLAIDVTNRLEQPIAELRVTDSLSEETFATLTGAPLPLEPDANEVFNNLAVLQEDTNVTVAAFDGDGNKIGTGDGRVPIGSPEPVFIRGASGG